MTLDLARLAKDVPQLATQMAGAAAQRGSRLAEAWQLLGQTPAPALAAKIAAADGGFDWPLASLLEEPTLTKAPATAPPEFQVLASDGSQIEFDRHQPAPCLLINLGACLLIYGAQPGARFWSQPQLYLAEPSPRRGQLDLADAAMLRLQRAMAEAQFLAQKAAEVGADRPSLALLDGSLVLWGLEGRRVAEPLRRQFLDEGYLRALDGLRAQGAASPSQAFGLASYISHPRSAEVTGVARLAACPYPAAQCAAYCAQGQRPCDQVNGLLDRDLFGYVLAPGERSALFLIRTPLVQEHYGEHEVAFFYLRLETEIARVEVPRWVAQDAARLELVHGLIWDQCRRGQGYPVALAEAHEQAVVTAADREGFWRLMERALAVEQLDTSASAKSLSKRTRWI